LGLAVFEAYGAVVERFAPPPSSSVGENGDDGKDRMQLLQDPYARASVLTHIWAGALGGGAHGLAASVWDAVAGRGNVAPTTTTTTARFLLHHATAHATLFGTYEGSKRWLLASLSGLREHDETIRHLSSVEYLGVVAVAGGLSGQAQHLVSHYSEQVILCKPERTASKRVILSPILLRPLVAAFLPSSIAFVAFEYGRSDYQ